VNRLVPLLLSAILVAACTGSTAKPTPPDPYPDGPRIICPDPVTLTSPTGQPTTVVFGALAVSGGAPPVTDICTPANQSAFPIGATTVNCTATDARQRTATCSFQVTVQAPPKLTATRFLAFGDSLTVGEDGNALHVARVGPAAQVGAPYPSLLRSALAARYTTQSISVSNMGLRGEPLAYKSIALPPPSPPRFSQTLAGGQYEVALILEGANDLQNRDDRDIPPAIAALQTMVRDARSRGVKVVLATLPPENPQGRLGLPWTLVPTFNSMLKSMAAAENVPVAEIYTAFGGDAPNYGLLSGDGLHPNQEGYQKIADAFFATIKANFEVAAPTTTLVPMGLQPIVVAPARRR
jgi:lysophospholipase L1-like esterase